MDAADCGHESRVWICVPRALAGVASDFQPAPPQDSRGDQVNKGRVFEAVLCTGEALGPGKTLIVPDFLGGKEPKTEGKFRQSSGIPVNKELKGL